MRRILSVSLLSILLVCSAARASGGVLVGDIQPPPPCGDVEPCEPNTPDSDLQNEAATTFVQIILDLLALS